MSFRISLDPADMIRWVCFHTITEEPGIECTKRFCYLLLKRILIFELWYEKICLVMNKNYLNWLFHMTLLLLNLSWLYMLFPCYWSEGEVMSRWYHWLVRAFVLKLNLQKSEEVRLQISENNCCVVRPFLFVVFLPHLKIIIQYELLFIFSPV